MAQLFTKLWPINTKSMCLPVGNPGSRDFIILGISLIPSAAGVRLYYTQHIITNTKSRPFQKQLPGPNKEQGSLISVPTCSWMPAADTPGWGRGYGRTGATSARPIEKRAPCISPPPSRAGSPGEGAAPEGGVPGGAGSPEPRGRRRYL